MVTTEPQNYRQQLERQETAPQRSSLLYIGAYETYGYGGGLHLISGMGFTLLSDGRYYDSEKDKVGKYVYNSNDATITFEGGFLDGQTGKEVTKGFWLSETVYCEPWR